MPWCSVGFLTQVVRLKELGHVWNHLHDRCGWLVATCIVLIMRKIDFHIRRPVFLPGLVVTDRELGAAGESGIGAVFQLTVELFACKDSELCHF